MRSLTVPPVRKYYNLTVRVSVARSPAPKINLRKFDHVILCSASALGNQTAKRMQDMAKERVSAGKPLASIAAMALSISSDDLSTTVGSSFAWLICVNPI